MWNRRQVLLCASAAAASLSLAPAQAENSSPKFNAAGDWVTAVTVRGSVYRYTWLHRGETVSIAVRVDPDAFIQSNALRRLMDDFDHDHGSGTYVEMAERDPYRKTFLSPVVEAIADAAQVRGEDPLFMLLTFVQGLPYKRETDWQSWPTETLVHMHGDCSDTAVLYAALVEQYQARRLSDVGCDPLWVFLQGECRLGHLAVGIRDHSGRRYSGTFYRTRGFKWYVAETTGTGWEIGDDNCLESAEIIVPRSWSCGGRGGGRSGGGASGFGGGGTGQILRL